MKQLRTLDWEALAGIAAACTALVLHLLHIAETDILLAVALVILALLLLRDLRRESRDEEESAMLANLSGTVNGLAQAVTPAEVAVIGPRQLRNESERFARGAHGEMLWFNVCLSMFEPQELFDVLLRPALENPHVVSVQFILDNSELTRWENAVLPKARASTGFSKLLTPRFAEIEESLSFILADNEHGEAEAHVSFWGEPFMASQKGASIPRYVLYVRAHSPLIGGFQEVGRSYRASSRQNR